VTVHELSRTDARRIAVRAQLLDRSRPAELLDVVRHLTLLKIDPVAAIAPSAELVAWSRLGSAFPRAGLRAELENRTLLELPATIRPSEDLALYRADMAAWDSAEGANPPGWRSFNRDWVRANDARCRSCTATAWWASWTRRPTARPAVLRVRAIHQDVAFTKAVTAAVDHECRDLARWLGLELAPPA
jgi:uncharacterized protein YcaQ